MSGSGVEGELTIDWPALMKHKESIIEDTPGSLEQSLSEMGVETLHGGARFIGRNTVMVNDREVDAKHIVIAVGQRPRTLGFPGAEHVLTSNDFLDLPELPRRIVFVGGGFISMEFAHIAARAGAEVTVLQRGDHILKGFDPDLADRLTEASRELGVDIRLNTEVAEVDRTANGESPYTVATSDRMEIEADLVVHGAGRVPELDELDLDTGDIAFDSMRGVTVNEFLQSVSNTSVYVAGDAADTPGQKLTPVAVHEGMIAVGNILKSNQKRADYRGTPSVAFTVPSLARAGLLEEEARTAGYDVEVKSGDMSEWYTLRRTNESHGAYKVVIDRNNGAVLGAHLLGGHAGETINIFAAAIRNGICAFDLKTGIYVHPAATSDVAYML
jgi:glutathione reductase (NADPH)